ncbi:MAG TPA: arginine deiminase family protein [Anaerolineae bacterium]|nr:arginine deiminase family protein [Anaerolineae bacterium]
MLVAITREVSPNMGDYESFSQPRQTIDIDLARKQHSQYEDVLGELGCQVIRLPMQPRYPDSVFVEDTAIVLDELAIISRPGAESRRGETEPVAEVLSKYRSISRINSPGTLEGGDVLQLGRTLYVGLSERTNQSGASQLRDLVAIYGYEVETVPVDGCLHLKSAVTHVGKESLLINKSWIDAMAFRGKTLIEVDPGEPNAANSLLIAGELMYSTMFPATRRRLEEKRISVRAVEMSEFQKAEGAVTCCSLIFRDESLTKGELAA